jgi:hypothetical protein
MLKHTVSGKIFAGYATFFILECKIIALTARGQIRKMMSSYSRGDVVNNTEIKAIVIKFGTF